MIRIKLIISFVLKLYFVAAESLIAIGIVLPWFEGGSCSFVFNLFVKTTWLSLTSRPYDEIWFLHYHE